MDKKKKIIVVGGGFAGVEFVKKIDKKRYDILLIDKVNHHQFQPLFYQVASSQIEPSSNSFPLRYIFRDYKSVEIRLGTVVCIHPQVNQVETTIGNFYYDELVLANGGKTNFFGNK